MAEATVGGSHQGPALVLVAGVVDRGVPGPVLDEAHGSAEGERRGGRHAQVG